MKLGKNISDVLSALWEHYNRNPAVGITKDEVLDIIEDISNKAVRDQFELRISTTEDIDFESYYREIGLEFEWDELGGSYLGVDFKFNGDRVFIEKSHLDGPAYKAGINPEDEILAINGIRFLQAEADTNEFSKLFKPNKNYNFLVSRLGTLLNIEVLIDKAPRKLKKIKVIDEQLALRSFLQN